MNNTSTTKQHPERPNYFKHKLLIFDFDGTLCDTGPSIHLAINKTLEKMGHKSLPKELVLSCIGGGFNQLASKAELDQVIGMDKIPEFVDLFRVEYDELYIDNSKPFSGAVDFLKAWPHELAIASNKEIKYVEALANQAPLNQFHWVAVYGGNSFPEKKPNPMMIESIIEKSQYGPEETIMIGDGEPDILVAKNLGIKSIAVSFGYCDIDLLMDLGADTSINSYEELPAAIERLSE